MEDMKIPTMLTICQAAEKANLSPYFVRKLVHENRIFYVKSGCKYLINFERLLEYLNTGQGVL